jgi:hypothetical protein
MYLSALLSYETPISSTNSDDEEQLALSLSI